MLRASSSNAGSKPERTTGVVENLDDWDLAALRKCFHDLEEMKNRFVVFGSGICKYAAGFAPLSSSTVW